MAKEFGKVQYCAQMSSYFETPVGNFGGGSSERAGTDHGNSQYCHSGEGNGFGFGLQNERCLIQSNVFDTKPRSNK